MKKESQNNMFDFFDKNGIENFIGVPDSTMKHFINQGIEKNKIIIATREEEAIGIATGMILAKSPTIVFMQNAGFGNSISTITSLVQMYKIPIIFIIGWRGYLTTDAPEHVKLGKIQPEIIKSLGLKSKILSDSNWKKMCVWALNQQKKGNICSLIIKREFHD